VYCLFLAHGTFIGTIRLEKQKPTQVQVDSVIRFGASTRSYTLREKPTVSSKGDKENTDENEEINQTSLIGLPETDTELDVSCANIDHLKVMSFHHIIFKIMFMKGWAQTSISTCCQLTCKVVQCFQKKHVSRNVHQVLVVAVVVGRRRVIKKFPQVFEGIYPQSCLPSPPPSLL